MSPCFASRPPLRSFDLLATFVSRPSGRFATHSLLSAFRRRPPPAPLLSLSLPASPFPPPFASLHLPSSPRLSAPPSPLLPLRSPLSPRPVAGSLRLARGLIRGRRAPRPLGRRAASRSGTNRAPGASSPSSVRFWPCLVGFPLKSLQANSAKLHHGQVRRRRPALRPRRQVGPLRRGPERHLLVGCVSVNWSGRLERESVLQRPPFARAAALLPSPRRHPARNLSNAAPPAAWLTASLPVSFPPPFCSRHRG